MSSYAKFQQEMERAKQTALAIARRQQDEREGLERAKQNALAAVRRQEDAREIYEQAKQNALAAVRRQQEVQNNLEKIELKAREEERKKREEKKNKPIGGGYISIGGGGYVSPPPPTPPGDDGVESTKAFMKAILAALATEEYTPSTPIKGKLNVSLFIELLRENANYIGEMKDRGVFLNVAFRREEFYRIWYNTILNIDTIIRGHQNVDHYGDIIETDDEFQPAFSVSLRVNRKETVAYFPYVIKYDCVDQFSPEQLATLNKCQIYVESDLRARGDRKQCLVNAIEQSCGVVINVPEDMIVDGYIATTHITDLAKLNNIVIACHYMDKKNLRYVTKYKPSLNAKQFHASTLPKAHICWHEKHAMPYLEDKRGDANILTMVRKLVETKFVRKLTCQEMEMLGLDIDVGLPPIPTDLLEVKGKEYGNYKIYEAPEFSKTVDEIKDTKSNRLVVIYDFETFKKLLKLYIAGKDQIKPVHKAFMISYMMNGVIYTKVGLDCAMQFLNHVQSACKRWDLAREPRDEKELKWCINNRSIKYIPRKHLYLYAHNGGFYDSSFIVEHLSWARPLGSLASNKGYTGGFMGDIQVTLRDTRAFLACTLKDMPKLTNVDTSVAKAVMPYDLYTEDTIKLEYVDIDLALSFVKKAEKEEFKTYAIPYTVGNKFYHMKYCQFYCEKDVEVLAKCFNSFKEQILKGFELDVDDFCTISSLANAYIYREGGCDGLFAIGNDLRAYIQPAVEGGRCNTHLQMKIKVRGRIIDLDANSLYPCAMMFLNTHFGGLPVGRPIIMTKEELTLVKAMEIACIVTARIKRLPKKLDMPILSTINNSNSVMYRGDREEGSKIYINELPENGLVIRCTSIKLISLFTYHECGEEDIQIIDGIKWELANDKLGKSMKHLYDMRLNEKKLVEDKVKEESLEEVIKLIMNSVYGKFGQKPFKSSRVVRYFEDEASLAKILNSAGDKMLNYAIMSDSKVLVETHTEKIHYNRCQISAFILDAAKFMMHRIFTALENTTYIDENGVEQKGCCYYNDTDSIHMNQLAFQPMCEEVKTTHYGISKLFKLPLDIMGVEPMKFKSDFKVKGSGTPDADFPPVSVYFIGLGAKAYMHKILFKENGVDKYHYTYKIKGIPKSAIDGYVEKHGCTIEQLFERLHEGEEIDFDMLANDRVSFEKDKRGNIYSVTSFNRKVKF